MRMPIYCHHCIIANNVHFNIDTLCRVLLRERCICKYYLFHQADKDHLLENVQHCIIYQDKKTNVIMHWTKVYAFNMSMKINDITLAYVDAVSMADRVGRMQ